MVGEAGMMSRHLAAQLLDERLPQGAEMVDGRQEGRAAGLLEEPLRATVHNGNGHRSASGLRETAIPLVNKVTQKMDGGRFCVQRSRPPSRTTHNQLHDPLRLDARL
jgi:hypothetical protein